MVSTGRLPHALLFAGPYGVGKSETALELARILLCREGVDSGCRTCSSCTRSIKIEHPDLHLLFPFPALPKKTSDQSKWTDELIGHRKMLAAEHYQPVIYEKGRQIVKVLVSEVHEKLLESSFEGGRKVCVILNAERLNATTANSLLKILEEPPAGVHLILTTERISSVLPTITSRASVIRFRRLKEHEITAGLESMYGPGLEKSASYASLAEGSMKTARAFLTDDKEDIRSRANDMFLSVALKGHEEVLRLSFLHLRTTNTPELEELIGGFSVFTRSVLREKCGIMHRDSDYSEHIQRLAALTDVRALRDLSRRFEDGLEMLGRFVNASTVMTSLFYGIHDTFRQ